MKDPYTDDMDMTEMPNAAYIENLLSENPMARDEFKEDDYIDKLFSESSMDEFRDPPSATPVGPAAQHGPIYPFPKG
jgi:hypothetical protein